MTLEQKEKHLNRFCKTCFNSGIYVGKQEAQKETAEKVEKLKIVMSRSYSVGDLLINDIDKIFGDNSQQNKTEKNLRDEDNSITDCRIKPADKLKSQSKHKTNLQ